VASTFQKLGVDRISQNIARAVNSPRGSLVTGDITAGEVVSVTITSGEGSATVSQRRTGAIPIGQNMSYGGGDRGFSWSISGTTLSVETYGDDGTMDFWVF